MPREEARQERIGLSGDTVGLRAGGSGHLQPSVKSVRKRRVRPRKRSAPRFYMVGKSFLPFGPVAGAGCCYPVE